MANPILVFVRSNALGTESGKFPIGVTQAGRKICNATCENGEFILVLVDDDQMLPDTPPFHAERNVPLLIVSHGGSTRHGDPDKSVGESWGWQTPCIVCKSFSHISSDTVYSEIRSVWIEDPGKACEFAKTCRAVDYLAALDGLAAVCQLKKLNPAENVVELIKRYLSRLDRKFAAEFRSKVTHGQWDQAFNLVENRANEIVSGGT